MKQNEKIEDIYQLDTNGIDLARGIEEDKTVDLDVLIKHTKQKLYKNKKRTIRERFYLANNLVKAAVIAGVILLGATTVTATVMIARYIPNGGVTHNENIRVLPVPYTVTVENKSGNGDAKYCYLRIVSLSYDGKLLEMDVETNWQEKSLDENSAGTIGVETRLKGNDGIGTIKSMVGKTKAEFGVKITKLHQVYEVSNLEGWSLVLPWVSKETNAFEIPLKDLQLVEPKEAESVEQLGQVAEDQGIRLVAVKSKLKDIQNIDFIQSKQPSDIIFEGLQNYVIKDPAGKELQVLDTDSNYGALPYLLLKCQSDFKGRIEASKIQVSKNVNQTVTLEIPKAGETKKINQTISLNDMELVIDSISVEDKPNKVDGEYWIEVACEVKLPNGSKYSIGDGTQIMTTLIYKDIESASRGYRHGTTVTFTQIPKEEFKPGETMTLQLDSIKGLTLSGQWSWSME